MSTLPARGAPKVRADAEFDIVLYGATGFTGKLAAHYLARMPGSFSFALAGRSEGKLLALKAQLAAEAARAGGAHAGRMPSGVIVAASDDSAALTAMVRRAKTVVTAAGPYQLYGKGLVEACAREGTHYADLSGETAFQRQMIDKHHATAHGTGAKIVLAAGYDSVPFDVSAALALGELDKVTGRSHGAVTIASVLTGMCGWASAGTLLSGLDNSKLMASGQVPSEWDSDPYLHVPSASCRVDSSVSGWGSHLRVDGVTGALAVPHLMAQINARIVRRSMELIGRRNISYSEGMTLHSLWTSTACITPLFLSGALPLMPPPGGGPPPELQEVGYASGTTVATDEATGQSVRLNFFGRGDPGYRHTSKLLVEVGLCLANVSCHREGMGGGVLTPVSATDLVQLVSRLREATHEDGRPLLTYTRVNMAGKQTDEL